MNSSYKSKKTIEVMCCYAESEQDELLLAELEKHLSALKRENWISYWDKRKVNAGQEEWEEVKSHLSVASIILLLLSPDFIATDVFYEKQIPLAIERCKAAEAFVIPVILRPCDWHSTWLSSDPAFPKNHKAITEWDNLDSAFQAFAQEIRNVVKEIDLRDRRGVNKTYEQLKHELSEQNWQKADKLTKGIMLKVSDREQAGFLEMSDLMKFPFQDIYAMNQLWVEYSNGQYGFSVQKQILQQGGYGDFLEKVGWKSESSWLKYDEVNYTTEGVFPYFGVHFWDATPLAPPEAPNIPYTPLAKTPEEFYQRYPYPRYYPAYAMASHRQHQQLRNMIKQNQQREIDKLFNPYGSPPIGSPGAGAGGAGAALVAGSGSVSLPDCNQDAYLRFNGSIAMTDLLLEAFKKAQNLPDRLQDELAQQLLEDIENELKWQYALSQEQNSSLDDLARQALQDSERGKTKVMGFDEL